jgi:7-cyano-7-deazaguanine synthase in queuosine biosynthesis
MKTWNIILKKETNDNFDIPITENKITIETYKQGRGTILSTNIFTLLNQSKLKPNDNVFDLLHFSLGLYTVDQVVSRAQHGFQGWSRHLKIYVSVTNLDEWMSVKAEFEELMSFLSGDKWEFIFRENKNVQQKQNEIKLVFDTKIDAVALFSGGMDSFINALDSLENKKEIAFVSHYKRGGEGKVQNELYNELENYYGKDSFKQYQFWVQPQPNFAMANGASKEETSRARSLLFICLGLTVANSFGKSIELVIPENGLISLNVPLTGTRLSSHSTRTTHPFYLSLLNKVVQKLNIGNKIVNPYQFKTKGEMICECKNQELFKKLNPKTVSCSHSDNSRYHGLKPGVQCGHCVPCLIRQAAENKGNIDGTDYVTKLKQIDISPTKKSGSDIRAFKLALERMKAKTDKSLMFDILSSGPLPFEDNDELLKYIDMYKRGIEEVKVFLEK